MPSRVAIRLREIIEVAVQSLPDKDASEAHTLFPHLHADGSLVPAKKMIQFNGQVFRAGSNLWDTAENAPDQAPELWEALTYRDGIRIIPAQISVTAAFAAGERGWWGNTVYESKVDSNVYTPDEYSDNWREYATM